MMRRVFIQVIKRAQRESIIEKIWSTKRSGLEVKMHIVKNSVGKGFHKKFLKLDFSLLEASGQLENENFCFMECHGYCG